MEPLTVASSIAGLITAGAQLVPQLHHFAGVTTEASQHAKTAAEDIEAITTLLMQLQKYIDGTAHTPWERAHLIHIEHITATLTACVLSYSDIDALIKSVHVSKRLERFDEVVWALKKKEIGSLVLRLENCRASLHTMWLIVQCTVLIEVESYVDQLSAGIEEIRLGNKAVLTRIEDLESMFTGDSDSTSMFSVEIEDDVHEDPTLLSETHGRDFEEQLLCTRVYRQKSFPINTTTRTAIDSGSSLSLGDISNISVYALPISAAGLSNHDCYRPVASSSGDTRLEIFNRRSVAQAVT